MKQRYKILDDLDFEVVREDWNIYKVPKDNSIIRFKLVLTKIVKTDLIDPVTKNNVYGVAFQTLVSVKSKTKGNPSEKLPSQDEIPNLPKKVVKHEVVREDWNIYRIDKESIYYDIKPVVTVVYRVDELYDSLGYPFYWVISQYVTRVRKFGEVE